MRLSSTARLSFTTSGNASTPPRILNRTMKCGTLQEPAQGCSDIGKGLSDYLALPLDQYSLLDPKWITRPEPDAQDVFLLKVCF